MDDRRTAGALTDTALDREIDTAVRVDASPGFLARVRTRIAAEPAEPRFGWFFVAAAAAAAIVVAALLLSRTAAHDVPTALLASRQLALPSPAIWNLEMGMRKLGVRKLGMRNGESGMSVTPSEARIPHSKFPIPDFAIAKPPEVLIDPREAQALQALIDRVRFGRVDLSPVLAASKPDAMDLPPVTEIVISPLAIEPLAPQDGAQGVRQ